LYLRLISKSPLTLENQHLQWILVHKILNRKIKIIHFQNRIFDVKLDLKNNFSKI